MGRPPKGSRTWLAWQRAEEILADGEWHFTSNVLEQMMKAGGIQKRTAANLLSEAVGWGVVERQGYKLGRPHGGYIDRRQVRSIPDKQRRFERERAGHVTEPVEEEPARVEGPPTRRVGPTEESTSASADEQTSHVAVPDEVREELMDEYVHRQFEKTGVEYEREKGTGKSRPRPSSPTKSIPDVTPEPVNEPGKVLTEEEMLRLQNKVRNPRRRPRRIPGRPPDAG